MYQRRLAAQVNDGKPRHIQSELRMTMSDDEDARNFGAVLLRFCS